MAVVERERPAFGDWTDLLLSSVRILNRSKGFKLSRVKTLFCFHFTDIILEQQFDGNNTLWIFHTEMCRDYYWRIWKFLNMYENVLDRAHEFQCKFRIGSWCKGSFLKWCSYNFEIKQQETMRSDHFCYKYVPYMNKEESPGRLPCQNYIGGQARFLLVCDPEDIIFLWDYLYFYSLDHFFAYIYVLIRFNLIFVYAFIRFKLDIFGNRPW